MAGFLDFSQDSPGPGISKNEKHNCIIQFLKILKRKFWSLIKLNLLYFIFILPALALNIFIISFFYFPMVKEQALSDFGLRLMFSSAAVCFSLITIGPAQAGFTFVLRNYAREENAFIWSDFIKHTKQNWKQSTIVCLIDVIVVSIIGIAIKFYKNYTLLGSISNIFVIIAITVLIIYAMMHMYIYPMMVTFDLKVGQLYKNALRFVIGRLPFNLLIFIIVLGITFGLFCNFVIGMFIMPIIGFSLNGLIINSFVYPAIKKYIMDKVERNGVVSSLKV